MRNVIGPRNEILDILTNYPRMTHICVTRANVVNRGGRKYASKTPRGGIVAFVVFL